MGIIIKRRSSLKRKIGILILSDIHRRRQVVKSIAFDNVKYHGFRQIIKDIDRNENDVEYISLRKIQEKDVVLVSVTSYMDVINLIAELSSVGNIKPEIIVGGPGVVNIRPYKKYIDVAVFRRAEGRINQIINHKKIDNVWYKKDDPHINKTYKVGKLQFYIGKEDAVGCRQRCYFCQYGWSNKFKCKVESEHYTSGFDRKQDNFKFIQWDNVDNTAIDGLEEKTRILINKKLYNRDIIDSLERVYTYPNNRRYLVKTYCIIGLPTEDKNTIKMDEIRSVFQHADKPIHTHDVIIAFHLSHFVPMPLTPMFFEPVSLTNYRLELEKKYGGLKHRVYNGININVYTGKYTSSVTGALEQSIINRAWENDRTAIETILLSSRYRNAGIVRKLQLIKQYFPEYLYCERDINEEMPSDYLDTGYDYKKHARVYYENKKSS